MASLPWGVEGLKRKWIEFRSSTEVNEGEPKIFEVSDFLKSPSLPLFPSVFRRGRRETTDDTKHDSYGQSLLCKRRLSYGNLKKDAADFL
jgi:hypothetical protein